MLSKSRASFAGSGLARAALLISPFFLWGTAMVAMKGALAHLSPLLLSTLRLLPAGVLILIATAVLKRSQPQTWRAWLWISLFALVDGAMFQGFLAMGLARTGAGLGSVTIDSQPLAVAVMAAWFYGERIGRWGWLGLGLGVVGIALVGLPDAWILALLDPHQWGQVWSQAGSQGWQGVIALHPSELLAVLPTNFPATLPWVAGEESLWLTLGDRLWGSGVWWMLLAALSMATGTVMMRAVAEHADPVVATGWHAVLGGLPLAGLAWWETGGELPWAQVTGWDWAAIAYSTVFGTAIAYGVFFYFAAQGNVTSLSSLTFLTPVFALLFGNIFLGEWLTPVQTTGVLITLGSVFLVNQREAISASPSESESEFSS
jgi:drug/metabolite transporter (DMT)-like permease